MTIVARISHSVKTGGETLNSNKSIIGNSGPIANFSVAAAKSGSLTTRTSNTVGTLTMAAGHGFVTGNTIDLFWAGGKRLNVILGTVSTNSCPFTSGTGDNLPASSTTITAMVNNAISTGLQNVSNYVPFGLGLAASLQALMISSLKRSVYRFYYWNPVSSEIDLGDVVAITPLYFDDNISYEWHLSSGATNPIPNDYVAFVQVTHGELSILNVQVAALTL